MSANTNTNKSEDELEAMKRRVRGMEEEATRIREMHAQVARDMGGAGPNSGSLNSAATADQTMASTSTNTAASGSSAGPSQESIDSRSVYVGNVDYGTTTDELHAHFQSCGTINRITIVCDKFTGHPKGFGYIEFADEAAVQTALSLNESLFRNRILKVTAKRTNIPGYNYGGRGGAAAGGYVMMPVPMAMMRGGRGMMPGRGGRGYRGGAAGRSRRFSPY